MDRIDRMEIVNRRLQFDTDASAFLGKYENQEQQLTQQIIYAREQVKAVAYSDIILASIADTCIQYQVEGLRADILLLKAARAHAAFYSRKEVTREDIHRVMPFVLSHRSKHYSSPQNSQQQRENQSPREEKEGDSISIRMS